MPEAAGGAAEAALDGALERADEGKGYRLPRPDRRQLLLVHFDLRDGGDDEGGVHGLGVRLAREAADRDEAEDRAGQARPPRTR